MTKAKTRLGKSIRRNTPGACSNTSPTQPQRVRNPWAGLDNEKQANREARAVGEEQAVQHYESYEDGLGAKEKVKKGNHIVSLPSMPLCSSPPETGPCSLPPVACTNSFMTGL